MVFLGYLGAYFLVEFHLLFIAGQEGTDHIKGRPFRRFPDVGLQDFGHYGFHALRVERPGLIHVPVPDDAVLGDVVVNKVFDIIDGVRVGIESGQINFKSLVYGVDSNCQLGDDAHHAAAGHIQAAQIRERTVPQVGSDAVIHGRTSMENGPVGENDLKVKD